MDSDDEPEMAAARAAPAADEVQVRATITNSAHAVENSTGDVWEWPTTFCRNFFDASS